jgi:hypothetical protein
MKVLLYKGFALSVATWFLLTAVICVVAASAAEADISHRWQGAYHYSDKRSSVPFELEINVTGNTLTGRTSEPATFGKGASYLYATIYGSTDGSNIRFTKTYDGTGGVSHSVEYSGNISADGSNMSGRWSLGNASGSFSATALELGGGLRRALQRMNDLLRQLPN